MLHRWIRLPDSFAHVMAASPPSWLWLQSKGCPHGPIRVTVDFSANGTMFLRKEWKNFLRSKNIPEGRTIYFSYDGDFTLTMRFFDGDRVDCCFESAGRSDEDFVEEVEE